MRYAKYNMVAVNKTIRARSADSSSGGNILKRCQQQSKTKIIWKIST